MTKEDILTYLFDNTSKRNIKSTIKKICGDKIGEGCYRDVYELKCDKRYVVKVQTDAEELPVANIAEWMNYINAEKTPLHKYLCPPLCLSRTGHILVMRRCRLATSKDNLPKFVPACITDMKIENWGFIGKRPYIFDYALFIPDTRMKKAKYWSLNKDKR